MYINKYTDIDDKLQVAKDVYNNRSIYNYNN